MAIAAWTVMERRHINSGAPAELYVAKRLVEMGHIVSFPFFGKAPYDMIADTKLQRVRVQVKTIYKGKTDNGTRWMVDFLKPQRKRYTHADCDYIIAASTEFNVCYIFNIEEVKDKRQATFYFDDKPNSNARNTEWVEGFKELWFK